MVAQAQNQTQTLGQKVQVLMAKLPRKGVWLNTSWGKKINIKVSASGDISISGSTYRVKGILKEYGFVWSGSEWFADLGPETFKALLDDLKIEGVDTTGTELYAEYLEVYHAWKEEVAQMPTGQVSNEDELRAWLEEKAKEGEK